MLTTDAPLVLVTAATGYIGGRIVAPLADAGFRVRAAARRPDSLARRVPAGVEVVGADAFDRAAMAEALRGVDIAFYLVHSLGAGPRYAAMDREAATLFAQEAVRASVRRIVYLGGLGSDDETLSEHLASRHEVGRILAASGIETLEFRASIVVGSGSTSFEMIRNLVEKLPVMPCPRWVGMPAQPIGVEDVVRYLTAAVTAPVGPSRIYEIGGPDVLSYRDLLALYADVRGLRRWIFGVPVLSPTLSGGWLALFTPLYARVGRQLAESLRHPTVVRSDAAARDFPDIAPIGARDAVERALRNEDREFAETRWSDELGEFRIESPPVRERRTGRLIDSRTIRVACPPAAAFVPIECIGGDRGWYAYDVLWDLRGWLDQLIGGVGSRRGRRDPSCALPGDTLDFYRVEAVERPRYLRLYAEMTTPGRGWLVYEVDPDPSTGGSVIRQTAIFESHGVAGLLYWYALVPFHAFVFNGTLRGIERECAGLGAAPDVRESSIPGPRA